MSQAVAHTTPRGLTFGQQSPALRLSRAHARPDALPGSRWTASSITDRVRALCAGRTPQALARLTGASVDAVRRYLRGAAAPAAFLVSLASAQGVSLNWVLTGRGPVRRSEVVGLALERSTTGELLAEMARRVSAGAAR